ncbi:MAG: AsmA family protein [Gammaproteobacteria bacterium]|nr:AsmA family protein [Gammaproteobacteria bacterium]
MARLVKILLVVVAAFVGIGIIASAALYLFFDPNDFRDDIASAVKKYTGRDLVIEGDLSLSVFPWIAVEVGRTELGNAEGFGDQPFLSFEKARLSVRLLPLLLRQDIAVGTASLENLTVNLAVAKNGRNNWDDLASSETTAAGEPSEDAEGEPATLDVANISVSGARLSYVDAQAGSTLEISELSFDTGRIAPGSPFDFEAAFGFLSKPGDMGGKLRIKGKTTLEEGFGGVTLDGLNVSGQLSGLVENTTEFNFDARQILADLDKRQLTLGEMDMSILGLGMSATVEPFSLDGPTRINAVLRVADFSLKELMKTFGSEPPPTADPNAMEKVSFSANAAISDSAIDLKSLAMRLDDTTMTGSLSLPLTESGLLRFDLSADQINLDAYMAPASETATPAESSEDADVEIPADMIRALNASGKARLKQATLGEMVFENLEMGLQSAGGKLRLHPVTAELFDGTYAGDVRIDASAKVPSISVNERVDGVSLKPLAKAMFDDDRISGTIRGSFVLNGAGATLSAIRRDLDGNLSMELLDGQIDGTDVWQQIRSARALLRGEQPPPARTPPRTEFSSIRASGPVTDGVFSNNDFLAEIPYIRMTGNGTVDLAAASLNYSLQARVMEKPEFAGNVSEAELKDYTQAVIPLKVSGPLASPSIKPDVNALLRKEIEKKGGELLDKLLGGEKEPAEGETAEGEEQEEKSTEDKVKDKLKDLFKR